MIELTKKQLMWLDQQGGRDEGDLAEDRNGYFVIYARGETKPLPKDEELRYKVISNGNKVVELA